MRLLERARHQAHVIERPESSLMRDFFFDPKSPDHADGFLEALAALGHRHAVDLELLGQESAAEAGVQAAAAHVVEHGQVAAEVGGMMERGYHGAGDDADAPGARRDRRKEYAGIGRMAAVVVERVLDGLDAAEPELVCARRDAQALLVVVRGAAVLPPERGKEVKSEAHAGCSPARKRA